MSTTANTATTSTTSTDTVQASEGVPIEAGSTTASETSTSKSSTKEPLIATALTEWNLMISNAMNNSEIAAILLPKGFSQEVLSYGQSLITTAQSRQSALTAALGAQKQATQSFRAALQTARLSYSDFRETARGVYFSETQNPQPWSALNLSGQIPDPISGFISKANATYYNALTDSNIPEALAAYGYDDAGVKKAQADIATVERANQAQEVVKGSCIAATSSRDAALKPAKEWVFTFKKIARRALKDRKDLQTMLGL